METLHRILFINQSSKTTEIYTNVLSVSNKNVQSPLDHLEEILNLVSPSHVDNANIDAIGSDRMV